MLKVWSFLEVLEGSYFGFVDKIKGLGIQCVAQVRVNFSEHCLKFGLWEVQSSKSLHVKKSENKFALKTGIE